MGCRVTDDGDDDDDDDNNNNNNNNIQKNGLHQIRTVV
jgi:hypothetical protein